MDIREFITEALYKVKNEYILSGEYTPIEGQYYLYNYVYDITSAIAEHDETQGLTTIKIKVKDGESTAIISEVYCRDGTLEEVYTE